jgi:hypothetical protein
MLADGGIADAAETLRPFWKKTIMPVRSAAARCHLAQGQVDEAEPLAEQRTGRDF